MSSANILRDEWFIAAGNPVRPALFSACPQRSIRSGPHDMTDHERPDVIDRAAGLVRGARAFAVRALRPEFVGGAEACRATVLEPADDLGLDRGLRAAIARRVARTADNASLLAEYPVPDDPTLRALSEAGNLEDDRLAAIAAHADMIASEPGRASEADLHRLLKAGLTVPQIVALSELLAFVCFQIRVVHGLSLLGRIE
jgi:uncharacterized protein YciW